MIGEQSADSFGIVSPDRVRNVIQGVLRAAQQSGWTDEALEQACGVKARRIKAYRVEGKEPALSAVLSIAVVLGPRALNAVLAIIGYRRGSVNNVVLLAHRVAWAIVHGEWPSEMIDHINGDAGDNRLVNLRVVTAAENPKNSSHQRRNTTGVAGVSWSRAAQRYWAQIGVAGEVVYLGLHNTLDEAATARKAAEARYGFHPNHGRVPA